MRPFTPNLRPDEQSRGSGKIDSEMKYMLIGENVKVAPGSYLLGTGEKNRSASLMQA